MKKIIQLLILLSLPVVTYPITDDIIKYVKEQIKSYDTDLSKELWGPKSRIDSRINPRIASVNESYRELRKSVSEFQNNTTKELGIINNDIRTLKNKIDLVTKHLLTVIDVIKTDKGLAKEYAVKEKIAVR